MKKITILLISIYILIISSVFAEILTIDADLFSDGDDMSMAFSKHDILCSNPHPLSRLLDLFSASAIHSIRSTAPV